MKIYAFPYAFGGANIYSKFRSNLDPNITMKAMNYPGHEERILEEPVDSIVLLAEDAYNQIKSDLEEDYYLLGYSMGGYVSVELYHLIVRKGRKPPKGIILLATDEPLADQELNDKNLESIEVIREILTDYGNTSKEVINDNELMELLAPIIKNDCIAIRNYPTQFCGNRIVTCPVLLIKGEEDADPANDLKWKSYVKDLTYEVVKGDHFFLFNSNVDEEVRKRIEKYVLG